MKRTDKYPDTRYFHYFNANPKNRITGDCLIRAISTACDISYNQVVMDFAQVQCETGYDGKKGIDLVMKRYGWEKIKQPKRADGTKYTGVDFCKVQQQWLDAPQTHGCEWEDGVIIAPKIVAMIGTHHIVAILDGVVQDIWNSTGGCIGNYWIKEDL